MPPSINDPLANDSSSSSIFLPPYAKSSSDLAVSQIRLFIIGKPKTGKTTSALTAPNPIVADFDRGMTGHADKKIPTIPFYDRSFCAQYNKSKPNPRDAFRTWLLVDPEGAKKLTSNQTLILDSWTGLQDQFDKQTELEPKMTTKGQIDEFDFWAKKQEYSRDIMLGLNALTCNVIVTFHELELRDPASGALLNKVQPLMQGRFVEKLGSYATDIFRMQCDSVTKKNSEGKPVSVDAVYYWQIKPDAAFEAGTRMKTNEYRVVADWKSIKY